jgi:molecular chaperone DnaJ
MARDLYDVLGVARNASPDDLKRAYRKLAKQYHPDTNKEAGSEDKFKEVSNAYAILSDDDKRARYDRFGMAGVDPQAGAGGFSGGFAGGPDLSEMFEELFGAFSGGGRSSGGGRKQPRQGRDLRYDMTLSFEESIFGTRKEIEIARLEVCTACSGNGAEPGTAPRRCADCNGTGELRQARQTFLGSMVNITACPRCSGTGEVIDTPCKTCRGAGKTRKTRKLPVTVPGGVDDTTRLRVAHEGDAGDYGGPNGSVQVFFRVQQHEYFKRRDHDIILDMQINIAQAALGSEVNVPTLDNEKKQLTEERLVIPPGTQSGKTFFLRGKGAPKVRSDGTPGGYGDQVVVVEVVVPTKLTPDQRRLFEELGRTLGTEIQKSHPGKGFFDRVADFFSGDRRD